MKKEIEDHFGIISLMSFALALLGYLGYSNLIEPNLIKQEVNVVSFNLKLALYEDWENTLIFGGNKLGKNPYSDLSKPLYMLTTTQGDYTETDYGNEAYILAKKCERYTEFEKSKAERIANKEAEELAFEKREQAEEDALDRLNAKPCN